MELCIIQPSDIRVELVFVSNAYKTFTVDYHANAKFIAFQSGGTHL